VGTCWRRPRYGGNCVRQFVGDAGAQGQWLRGRTCLLPHAPHACSLRACSSSTQCAWSLPCLATTQKNPLSHPPSHPATHPCRPAGARYHVELARQLADVLAAPLARAGGMLPLPDVYCLLNRARGTELVSPDDLLKVGAPPPPLLAVCLPSMWQQAWGCYALPRLGLAVHSSRCCTVRGALQLWAWVAALGCKRRRRAHAAVACSVAAAALAWTSQAVRPDPDP
jgi:hypothetical protein